MGGTTPRALDGVVDGVVKQTGEQSSADGSSGDGDVKGSSKEAMGSGTTGEAEKEGKDKNGMQTFFTKVRRMKLVSGAVRVRCCEVLYCILVTAVALASRGWIHAGQEKITRYRYSQ